MLFQGRVATTQTHEVTDACQPQLFQTCQRMTSPHEETRFFSLTGFMKSGTNWLGALLETHDDIRVIGEFHWQTAFAELLKNMETNPAFHDEGYRGHVLRQFDQAVKSSMLTYCSPVPKMIGERTPRPIEPLVMRDDPVINLIRDGRDVLVSRAFHIYNNPDVHRLFERDAGIRREYERFKANKWYFQKNPERLLCHELLVRESVIWWASQVKADRETIASHPEIFVHVMKYEDLHNDVHAQRKKAFEFLGVHPDHCEPIEGNLVPGFKKERPGEFLRKGAVGDWENYFDEDTKRVFNEVGGEELIINGYAESLNW